MSVKNYPVGTHMAGPLKLGTSSALLSTDVGGLSAAKTLTADESNGQSYILDGGTGFAVTLPVATKGWSCKFTIGAAFATDFVITAQSAIMEGCILEAGAVQDVAGATTLTLEDGVENVGDYIDLWSDGTSIFVTGNFLTALSITPA